MASKYLLNPVNVGSNRHQPGSVITDATVQAEVMAAGGLLVDPSPAVVQAAQQAQAAVKRGDLTAALGFMAAVAGGGTGTERIVLTDPTASYTLSRSGRTVLLNQTGVGFFNQVRLPDGVDGLEKEIVCGENGQNSPSPVAVRMNDDLGNDQYDLPIGASVKLAWVTASGGWVAMNYCPNVNANWD